MFALALQNFAGTLPSTPDHRFHPKTVLVISNVPTRDLKSGFLWSRHISNRPFFPILLVPRRPGGQTTSLKCFRTMHSTRWNRSGSNIKRTRLILGTKRGQKETQLFCSQNGVTRSITHTVLGLGIPLNSNRYDIALHSVTNSNNKNNKISSSSSNNNNNNNNSSNNNNNNNNPFFNIAFHSILILPFIP